MTDVRYLNADRNTVAAARWSRGEQAGSKKTPAGAAASTVCSPRGSSSLALEVCRSRRALAASAPRRYERAATRAGALFRCRGAESPNWFFVEDIEFRVTIVTTLGQSVLEANFTYLSIICF